MDREKLLLEIQKAYKDWSKDVEFTTVDGASDEDEAKIMDTISTLIEKNK